MFVGWGGLVWLLLVILCVWGWCLWVWLLGVFFRVGFCLDGWRGVVGGRGRRRGRNEVGEEVGGGKEERWRKKEEESGGGGEGRRIRGGGGVLWGCRLGVVWV